MNLPEGWPTEEMINTVSIVLRDYHENRSVEQTEKAAKLLIEIVLGEAPTPLAQEDEHIGYVNSSGDLFTKEYVIGFDTSNLRKVYTRPADDKLRTYTEQLHPLREQIQELLPLLMNGIMPSKEDLVYLRDLAYTSFEPNTSNTDKPSPG